MTWLDWILILMFINGTAWALSIVLLIIEQRFVPPLRANAYQGTPESEPLVSVLIPARNEERNIRRCLDSVIRQDYKNLEIIVIDDQSEDATAAIVAEFAERDSRVRLVRGKPLPEGWKGKGWALWQGHQLAKGDWVLLLDADTRLFTHAVTQTLNFALDRGISFLNPTPLFQLGSFWERVLQPFVWDFVLLRFPRMLVNSPKFSDNMAFGPFLLISREAYDSVGGHSAVCHSILEDVLLSKLIKQKGYKTYVVDGAAIFEVRMYTNLSEVLQGWTKTAFASMNYNLPLMLLAIVCMFLSAALPFLALPIALTEWLRTGSELAWLYVVATTFQVGVLWLRRLIKDIYYQFPLKYVFTHPFAVFLVLYMQMNSTWQYYFGAIKWKGRTYVRS